ncbi:hypothetical protein [Janthinobacterium sp. BJB401]|uniref:hypothetical protein n=1 Tax=Janthinobacterium sp. BJB401 TaxID=2745934 RepID=UPI0015963DD6|nr:hypothetical protein [Janthinobacterium sp. BJB401]NVI84316.1 hypothetical protein [Janthinobacterium sp. BJB401]
MKKSNIISVDIEAITFDENGEMVVLDDHLLALISGGAKPKPSPSPSPIPPIGSGNNAICGVNFFCPSPSPTPKPPGGLG